MNKKLGAIILAAGKGKRMQLDSSNKVTLSLGKKAIIVHVVHFLKNLGISSIVVVVGYHKQSVIDALTGEGVVFAEQKEQLGTGDALYYGLEKLPKNIADVLVTYGDDAVLYSEKNSSTIYSLLKLHKDKKNVITFLTIEQENSIDLGRVVRDDNGRLLKIIEEKDATKQQRKIKEINPGCFIFSVKFLKKYLSKIEKSSITGEYYLTSLIDIAIKNHEQVDTLAAGKLPWRGVNTKEELKEAERLYYGK
jgi:bifunctional UDP-N-acetylglucosamine pyrophosphorylase/glucosamine-1-phosphate N-acetyltransferase